MARQGNPEDLAPTVTLLRALRGWSKKQLADASGVDKSQVSRYELGKEVPSPRTMERLAAGVGLPPFLLEPMTSFIHRLREAMAVEGLSDAGSADSAGLSPEAKWAMLEAIDRAASQARAELKVHAARRAANGGIADSE
jgi:transcriptional regulator with XRE-family HTH domain